MSISCVREGEIVVPNEWKGPPPPELAAKRQALECQDGKCEVSSTHSEGEVMAILYVGIDLSKNVFRGERRGRAGQGRDGAAGGLFEIVQRGCSEAKGLDEASFVGVRSANLTLS